MRFRPASLKLSLPVLLAVATVLSAGAQTATQPVTSPPAQNGGAAPNAPSLTPAGTKPPSFIDNVEAPPSGFNFDSPSSQPPPMSAAPSAEDQRLQKVLQERQNWALMTPEEIFGVKTPEEIFGIQKRDAAGRVIQTTQVERFLARQEQELNDTTNNWQNAGAAEMQNLNFSGNRQAEGFGLVNNGQKTLQQFLDNSLNSAPDNSSMLGGQSATTEWPQSFGATTLPKANPQQQADMDAFNQLLERTPSATTVTPSSGSAGKFLSAPATTVNSILGQPAANSFGASFTPLNNGLSAPQGITPLTGITSPNQNNSQPAPAPSWTPQPAPWLSQGPQPFTVPQRQF